MKIQEVILKAMAGKLKWWEAAEIIGVTDRTMRRWRERYQEHGYGGLWDYRKKSPSPKRIAVEVLERVLQLYREKYFDFNVQALSRKAQRRARDQPKLHVGEDSPAGSGTGGAAKEARNASQEAAPAGDARHDAAHRCQ